MQKVSCGGGRMKKKLLIGFIATCCALALGATWLAEGLKEDAKAFLNDDTTSYVKIGELWNSTDKIFDKDNLSKLFQYISGDSNLKAKDISAISTLASTNRDSSYFRTQALGDKTSGKDIVVRFGGLDWTATYLSKDTDGNPILTLWLSNSTQDAFAGRNATEGAGYGFVNNGLYSTWSANWYSEYTNIPYPSNMYSTSYIRSVTLNNGGGYALSGGDSLQSHNQDSNNVFAAFTMGELAEYIESPKNALYQHDQSAIKQFGWSNDNANESPTVLTNPKYYTNGNYGNELTAQKPEYFNWANDKLWLPSITEIGFNIGYGGIWNTSTEQRQNEDGASSSKGSGVGSEYSQTAYSYSWLRSDYFGQAVSPFAMYPSGLGAVGHYASSCLAVRPALHLNLKSASDTIPETWLDHRNVTWDGNGTEDDPFLISTAEQLAGLSYNVSQGNLYDGTYGKYFKQTANIDLGAYPWNGIGTSEYPFKGYYDGNFFGITNINTTGENLSFTNAGLFVSAENATFKNIIVSSGTIVSSQDAGAICARAIGCRIENCVVMNVIVKVTTVDKYSGGGIAGFIDRSKVYSCDILNSTIEACYSGGMVGYAENTSYTVKDCSVRNTNLKGINAAPFSAYNVSATACFFQGNINSVETKKMVGGENDWTNWSISKSLPFQKSLYAVGGFSTSKQVFDKFNELGFISI